MSEDDRQAKLLALAKANESRRQKKKGRGKAAAESEPPKEEAEQQPAAESKEPEESRKKKKKQYKEVDLSKVEEHAPTRSRGRGKGTQAIDERLAIFADKSNLAILAVAPRVGFSSKLEESDIVHIFSDLPLRGVWDFGTFFIIEFQSEDDRKTALKKHKMLYNNNVNILIDTYTIKDEETQAAFADANSYEPYSYRYEPQERMPKFAFGTNVRTPAEQPPRTNDHYGQRDYPRERDYAPRDHGHNDAYAPPSRGFQFGTRLGAGAKNPRQASPPGSTGRSPGRQPAKDQPPTLRPGENKFSDLRSDDDE